MRRFDVGYWLCVLALLAFMGAGYMMGYNDGYGAGLDAALDAIDKQAKEMLWGPQ